MTSGVSLNQFILWAVAEKVGALSQLRLHLDADISIRALDRLLSETQAEELAGQVRWLSEWR